MQSSSFRSFFAGSSAVVLVLALSFASTARAQADLPPRFSTTAPGGIIATGNTLGLSKDTAVNGPGVRDSIGTLLSLDGTADDTPANAANPWPAGTTNDWHQDGSAANLALPLSTELGFASVLYAELIWGGSYNYGGEDVTADLDTPVTLSANGQSVQVTPDPTTALTLSGTAGTGFSIAYYVRSADVTDFVRAQSSGEYAVRGVPATQSETINSLNAAGWTLVVAYRDDGEPLRNLSIFVGGSFVDEQATQDYAVSGFCAPPSGDILGKAAISAIEGDANLTGDQLLIAPTANDSFVNLAGPNNPVDNFFCSQLNDPNGLLDTSGTFGDANQDAFGGVNIAGGRQGWDVTTVDVSSQNGQLFPGQQSAVLRTITTGDSYVPTLAAFQIDVNAPNLTTSQITPDQNSVRTGDLLTVTTTAHNTGSADASSLRIAVVMPQGLTLEHVSSDGVDGDIAGNAVDQAALAAGIDEGNLAPGATRTVVLQMRVTDGNPAGLFFVDPVWSYGYVTCTGTAPVSETYSHGTAVTFVSPTGTDAGSPGDVDAGSGGGDDAGTGGDVDAGTDPGVDLGGGGGTGFEGEGEGPAGAPEGCGCSSGSPLTSAGALASLLALALVGRGARRRRSR